MIPARSSSRVIAAILLLVVAAIPGGVWILFLTAPAGGANFLRFVSAAHGELKGVLVLMAVSAVFSLLAAIAVVLSRRPLVPRLVLAGDLAQLIAYGVFGAWPMVFFTAAPLWWLYQAQGEAPHANRRPAGPRMAAYMVIERYRGGDPRPVYQRFRERGRMAPEGLAYVSSWITEDLGTCYQVMETADRALLEQWMDRWRDLVDFEVRPVITSQEAAERSSRAHGS